MNNENRQFDFLDLLNIFSFMIGLENLYENRSQSAQNDVNAATDKQTHYLISEVKELFERQNVTLERQTAMLGKIIALLEEISN